MLDLHTRTLVKATAPVLAEHGEALTRHFYKRMLHHNPELREIFNLGHQHGGSQQNALAAAMTAYARNIDDPSVLMPAVERIASKHVSLSVRPEHYTIVGRHLLASIAEVLNDAATPELINAWTSAYGQLADLMIGLERSIYESSAEREGGWTGWRTFRVVKKTPESDEITSFELMPADGGSVPRFRPGQFSTVRLVVPSLGFRQPRQYSLSDAPGKTYLRISVKRESPDDTRPEGLVSNQLHDHVWEGDLIEAAPPEGDFYLHEDRQTPVVLVSAGVGITPMMSMLEHLAAIRSERTVLFLHAARRASVQAFDQRVRELVAALPRAKVWIVHGEVEPSMTAAQPDASGRLDLASLMTRNFLPPDADYYVCGPVGFMDAQISALKAQGVNTTRIHAEVFGTGGPSV